MSKCRICTKIHTREMEISFKQKARRRMNYEWIGKNHFEKNPIQKIEKKVKIRVKIVAFEQKKPLARKRNFVQPPFSHSTLKLE